MPLVYARAQPVGARLRLTRRQILAFRRRVGGLDERSPKSPESLRRAAWAGLQDSMPRAALLSLHARLDDVDSSTWEDPALAQLWGPRYNTYVVPRQDFALFSLGRLPDNEKGRRRAEEMAVRLHAHLAGVRTTDAKIGDALGINPSTLKYAAPTGTVAIRWAGARAAVMWTVPAADIDPADATRELARRYLHVFGPTTAERFAGWAGISRRAGAQAFASLDDELLPARHAARRRMAARRGRTGRPRRRDGRRARATPAERRRLLPAPGSGAGAAHPEPGSAGTSLDVSRLAGRASRRRRDPRHLAARAAHRARRGLVAPIARVARCGRGRGGDAAPSRPRPTDRGDLEHR